MAPTAKTMVPLTKPSVNLPRPPVFRWSQSPRRITALSRSNSSPRTVPSTMDRMGTRGFWESLIPGTAMPMTTSAKALMRVFCIRSGSSLPTNRPTKPPAAMAAPLTMEPNRIIGSPPFHKAPARRSRPASGRRRTAPTPHWPARCGGRGRGCPAGGCGRPPRG